MTTFRQLYNTPRPSGAPVPLGEANAAVSSLRKMNADGVGRPRGHAPLVDDRGCECGWVTPKGVRFAPAYVEHLLDDADFDLAMPDRDLSGGDMVSNWLTDVDTKVPGELLDEDPL